MKTLKRTIGLLAPIAVLGLLGFYLAKHLTIGQIASAQVQALPFTLEVNIYDFHNNPAGELSRRRVLARRSDGTTAYIGSQGPLSWGVTLKKITFMDGRVLRLADLLSAKSTLYQLEEERAKLKTKLIAPPVNCKAGKREFLGEETLWDQKVAVWTWADENHRVTEWMAPALGCEWLQYKTERKLPAGSFRPAMEGRTVSLVMGEPDANLFDGGSQYTEVKPSEIQKGILEKNGIQLDEQLKLQGDKMDEEYLQRRKAN
jgi:hypothetical protein